MTNLGIMEHARKLLDAAGRASGKRWVKSRGAKGAIRSARSNGSAQSNPQPVWMETEARVTDCRHDLVRMSMLTLRIKKDPVNLIVSFTYYAHARTYYDNFISSVAKAQGDTFSVYYNALNPRQNTLSPSSFLNRSALSDTAILGFTLLSMLLLAMASG